MNFYAILFWWLMGFISCGVLYTLFVLWAWKYFFLRGDVAIKDSDGTWIGVNLPNSADPKNARDGSVCNGGGE